MERFKVLVIISVIVIAMVLGCNSNNIIKVEYTKEQIIKDVQDTYGSQVKLVEVLHSNIKIPSPYEYDEYAKSKAYIFNDTKYDDFTFSVESYTVHKKDDIEKYLEEYEAYSKCNYEEQLILYKYNEIKEIAEKYNIAVLNINKTEIEVSIESEDYIENLADFIVEVDQNFNMDIAYKENSICINNYGTSISISAYMNKLDKIEDSDEVEIEKEEQKVDSKIHLCSIVLSKQPETRIQRHIIINAIEEQLVLNEY